MSRYLEGFGERLKMASAFPFILFIGLHKMLLSKMLLLDSILGILGSIFLLAPLHDFTLSLNNLPLLVLFVFSTVGYQIHIFRTYAGGATFYLNLPVEKYRLLLILFIDAVIPLLTALSITAIVLALSHMVQTAHIGTQIAIVKRAYYMVLILFMLKTIALPVFILYKRHIALILAFLGSLVFVYFLISIVAELLHISGMIWGFLFLASIEAICIRILMSAKIN
jgi:hypothetical protein